MTNVKQMHTVLAPSNAAFSFEDSIRDLDLNLGIETTAVSEGPKPIIELTTRLTALLIADIIGPTGLFGLEIVVDDSLRMEPIDVLRIDEFERYNFLAFVDGVVPGTHQVTIRWRPFRPPGAIFGKRTLTVWETVVEAPPPVVG